MPDAILELVSHVNRADGPVLIAAVGNQDEELASEPHRHARGQLFGSLRGLLSVGVRSEEHTSELQSQSNLVCRLLLEKKKKTVRLHCSTKRTLIATLSLHG